MLLIVFVICLVGLTTAFIIENIVEPVYGDTSSARALPHPPETPLGITCRRLAIVFLIGLVI